MENSKKRRNDNSDKKSIICLPMEILFEIFSKLSVVSILTCRCVCKTWYCFTKDQTFIEQLVGRDIDEKSRLIVDPCYTPDGHIIESLLWVDIERCKVKTIPNDALRGLSAMGTCRGLLCVAPSAALDPLFICNPATRELIRLPASRSRDIDAHLVGIGFNPATAKYKVLRTYVEGEFWRFEVITLGENSWRKVAVPFELWNCSISGPTYSNKAIHWKVIPDPKEDDYMCLLSFDVCQEKFHVTSFPEDAELTPFRLRYCPEDFELVEFGGRLSIVERNGTELNIWEVVGDKIEDLAICLRCRHDTYVCWNQSMTCAVLGRLSQEARECYLIQVSACYGGHLNRKEHLTQFFPETAMYLPLDIPHLPRRFDAVRGYQPSLVSPKTASLRPR